VPRSVPLAHGDESGGHRNIGASGDTQSDAAKADTNSSPESDPQRAPPAAARQSAPDVARHCDFGLGLGLTRLGVKAGEEMGDEWGADGDVVARGVWDGDDGGDPDPTADESILPMPPCSVWRQRVRVIKRAQHWGVRWMQDHRTHESFTRYDELEILSGGLVAEFGGRYR
jgi:hypothetical protein